MNVHRPRATLGRILFLGISAVFLLVIAGVQTLYLLNARTHLQEQLESHAQDAATSLGLSLGILLTRGDRALAETVINASFDRGYYERIEFVSIDNEVLVSKVLAPTIADVPAWFVRAFPMAAPTAESLVTTGWMQVGRVKVTSHSRFAYEQLWSSARDTLFWLALLYVLALLSMRAFLRGVLRPLAAIERAAEAIARREFVSVDTPAGTRELSRVVDAMNSLSGKVRAALEAETARAEQLATLIFTDEVTRLFSRGGFADRFKVRYEAEQESFSGALALVQISDFSAINRSFGQAKGDELMRAIGRFLGETAVSTSGFCGRWAGALFALALPGRDPAGTRVILEQLLLQVQSSIEELGMGGQANVYAAAMVTDAGHPALESLIRAVDGLLAKAAEQGSGALEVELIRHDGLPSMQDWSATIEQALREQRLQLAGQSVLALPSGEVLHLELMGRILDVRGTVLPAAEFMPMVGRLGFSARFDAAIVGQVAQLASSIASGTAVAINIAPRSLGDATFRHSVATSLDTLRYSGVRVIFELSEHGALQDQSAALEFAEFVRARGSNLAIDHYGLHRESLALAHRLLPAYVKLSGLHTPKLASDRGTRFYVESLLQAAHQLEVPVIAQSVEDAAMVGFLESMGFAGYQGYVTGRPSPWPPG